MNWLLLVLISAFSAATINHIDKFLITKHLKGGSTGALAIFSAMMGLPIFLLIAVFNPQVFSIEFKEALFIVLNGMIYVSWLLPYFYALEKDDASVVTPLFQLSAVFSYVIGFLVLGESMNPIQLLGAMLILTGSLGLTLEMIPGKKFVLKKSVLIAMAFSSLLVATNEVLFKFFAVDKGFWTVTFWEYVGFFVMALVLFIFVSPYRAQFLRVLRKNKATVLSINLINEVLAAIAKMCLNFATLLVPVAMVVFVAEGFQPFFVLGLGVLLTMFFPRLSNERLERKYLLQKLISITVMFVGTLLLV